MPKFITAENGDRIAYHATGTMQSTLAGVVFLGGFMSDMEGSKALALESWCVADGRPFVRFDYHGHGQSEGVFAEGTISRWTLSALAVLDQLTMGPQLLVGSSMGGWIALRCALLRPSRVKALVGVAAAPDFTKRMWEDEFDDVARAAVLSQGYVDISTDYGDTPYRITKALIDDGNQARVLGKLGGIQCPVHLIHGTNDDDVPVAVAFDLQQGFMKAGKSIDLTLVPGGDHRLSTSDDLDRLIRITSEMADHLDDGGI